MIVKRGFKSGRSLVFCLLMVGCSGLGDFDEMQEYVEDSIRDGKYHNALIGASKCLDYSISEFGNTSSKTASSYMSLGDVYRKLSKYSDSEKAYVSAGNILRYKVTERDQDNYVGFLSSMGGMYMDWGASDKSINYFGEALMKIDNSTDIGKIQYASILTSLSAVYSSINESEKAIKLCQQALPVMIQTYGKYSPEVIIIMNNLGVAYSVSGEYESACKIYEDVVASAFETFGVVSSKNIRYLSNLGHCQIIQNMHVESVETYKKALRISQKVFGEKHQQTAELHNKLGSILSELDNYDEAANHFSQAMASYSGINGTQSQIVCEIGNEKAQILVSKENYGEAEMLYKKFIEFAGHEPVNEKYGDACRNLARLYLFTEKYDLCEDYLVRAFDFYCDRDVSGDNLSFLTMIELGDLSFSTLQFNKAELYYLNSLSFLSENNVYAEIYLSRSRLEGLYQVISRPEKPFVLD